MGKADDQQSQDILELIASPAREAIPVRTVVVVAHPDDETIGCGALLPRLQDVRVIHVTDGAPRRRSPLGFGSWEDYRDARAGELRQAMRLAGIGDEQLRGLGWPDQEAAFHLPELARSLADELVGAELVLTHAFEGGHPDHDATAFAVRAACRLLANSGERPALVLDMPVYRAGPSGWLFQSFGPDETEFVDLQLTPDEQDLKRRMFQAHHSQREMLQFFAADREQFRPAGTPDFAALPNSGQLLYAGQDWGMTGPLWLDLTAAASRELGLGAYSWV